MAGHTSGHETHPEIHFAVPSYESRKGSSPAYESHSSDDEDDSGSYYEDSITADRDSGNGTSTPLSVESDGPRMDLDRSLPLGRQSEMTNWRSTSGRANLPTTCLQDELAAALVPTHPSQHDREFLPKEALTSILTEERVRQVLAVDFESVLPEKRINEYAKTICARKIRGDDGRLTTRSYIKILAILVLCRKTTAIVRILEDSSRVSDADLPLERVRRPGHDNLYDLRARNKSGMLLKPMECFQKDWDQMNIRSFEEWQWTALPRIFGKPISHEKVRHYDLRDKEILPFVQDSQGAHDQSVSSKHEFEGGFATVFQVAIHPQHHHFGRPPDALYAVKSLHSKNVTAFEREVEILNKFRGDQHSHLISLLATYQQHNRFFLLFDWADADLKTYWTVRNPSPSFDMSTVRWMARQCTGIAHGIIRIHTHKTTYRPLNAPGGGAATVFGHHGDIKPENVLWFAKPPSPSSSSSSLPLSEDLTSGTLKLSDFGLARFSIHQHTRSMTPASKWAATLAYRAPETDLHPEAAIGRSYDMWTLGCLYLEFVTWALGGKALLEQFVMQRRAPDGSLYNVHTHSFFELRVEEAPGRVDVAGKPRVRAVVKPSVKEFIQEKLRKRKNCAQFFHDVLDMVENDLLVVKSNDREQIDRVDIKQVHSSLAHMVERLEDERGDGSLYGIGRNPKLPGET